MTSIEVCPDCDIAGCQHIRGRNGQGGYSPAEAMRRQYDEVLMAGNRMPEQRGPTFTRDQVEAIRATDREGIAKQVHACMLEHHGLAAADHLAGFIRDSQ